MPSKKVASADDQQERLKFIGLVVGCIDGEGFLISLFRNETTKFGWQVFSEFVVIQGEKSKNLLEILVKFFKCEKVFVDK